MERRPLSDLKHARIVVVGLIVVVLLGSGVLARARLKRTVGSTPSRAEIRAPDSVRIRVQVLNATKTRGLARRATMLLRDRGFDVVETGTIGGPATAPRDSSLVLDLSGHPDWANRVAQVLGSARVEARPDSSRYLDITVVLGSSWRPPAVPFYP